MKTSRAFSGRFTVKGLWENLGAPLQNLNGGILGGSTAKRAPTLEKKNENYNVGQTLLFVLP